jgi:AMP-binding enzyme
VTSSVSAPSFAIPPVFTTLRAFVRLFIVPLRCRFWTSAPEFTLEQLHEQVLDGAHAFAARLRGEGIGKDEKLIFWRENRPKWIVSLWGCLFRGIVVVPIDQRHFTINFENRSMRECWRCG